MRKDYKLPKTKKANVWRITSGKEMGRWRWEMELTRKDGLVYRKAGTRKTEKEAIEARDSAFQKFNESGGRGGRQYTVRTWCEYCLNGGMTEQNARTRHSYTQWLRTRAYPVIGPIKLDELRVDTLQLFFQRLQEEDVPSAALRTRTALNACLTRATKEGLLATHPGRIATLQREKRSVDDDVDDGPGKRILTGDEQKALIEAARGTLMYWPVIFGLKFGLRAGECLGLKWTDFDFKKREVKIKRQTQGVPGEGVQFTELKTRNSYRTLPIPSSLYDELRAAAEQAKAEGHDLICRNNLQNQYTPQNLSMPFKSVAKKAGINGQKGLPDCTHHDLRSTFLTFLANYANNGIGVRPATLRAIAGHGKIDTTYRYYIRTSDTDLREAMEFVA